MRSLFHLVAKEWLVLSRDWHALLLLFAMPVLFILVMSLALRDRFASHGGAALSYYLIDDDRAALGPSVEERLRAEKNFSPLESTETEAELLSRVAKDEAHFLVVIPQGFGAALGNKEPIPIRIASGPGVEPAALRLFEAAVSGIATRLYTQRQIALLQSSLPEPPRDAPPRPGVDLDAAEKLVQRVVAGGEADEAELPTSVQQSVPAWLLFAMFFIAIPLSTTWVQERQQGTLARLRALGLPRRWLLLGKLVPYYVINLVQVALMLMVGVWLVPLCGGDALTLGHAPAALTLMAMAASFASVSYALLIANLVTTSEQATIFTGVSNLLLAVIGGVMVPRFIMPPAMQELSLYSPMAWGLEGFLDIFLRHGDLAAVTKEVLQLSGFGLVSLALAGFCMGRSRAR